MVTETKLWMKQQATGVIGLAIASIVSFAGCERDFPNPNAPIVEDVTVQSLVTGVEAGMRVDLAMYLRVVSSLGREGYFFEAADPRFTRELLQGTVDPGGPLLERPWRARYRTVANSRFLLDRAASLSPQEAAGVEGFAKTIMAYQLLLNLNYLDENGIKIDFSGILDNFASKQEGFDFIERLLDEANSSLASAGASFPFALSTGFAGFNTPATFAQFNRALKARVAVYGGKFNDALTALGQSFLDPGGDLQRGVYHVYGTGLGDQLNEIWEDPEAPSVRLMAHPTFGTDAEPGDPRFTSKTFDRPTPTTFDNLTTDLAVAILSSATDPFPIIRNEELILLRAEANIGLGNLGPAEADINAIRSAYGLSSVTLTAGNALDRLLYEKRYSLFLEGHRWVDVRRYGRLSQLPIDRTGDVVLDRMPRPETEVSG